MKHVNLSIYQAAFIIALLFLSGCKKDEDPIVVHELALNRIGLTDNVAIPNSEISGLTWYNDDLVFLPQFPSIFGDSATYGKLYKASKTAINNAINGNSDLVTQEITITNIPTTITEYQGFEAIEFKDNTAYLLIEAGYEDMAGYLIKGTLNGSASELVLDQSSMKTVTPPVNIPNAGFESIMLTNDKVLCIFEANGANVNTTPLARAFDFNLTPLDNVSFPAIEYRVTDATQLQGDNSFYALNCMFPGSIEKYNPAADVFETNFGLPTTHAVSDRVERLIMLKYDSDQVQIIENTSPIYLSLDDDPNVSRNFEGLVKLDSDKLLVITDKFPETVFGYVSIP